MKTFIFSILVSLQFAYGQTVKVSPKELELNKFKQSVDKSKTKEADTLSKLKTEINDLNRQKQQPRYLSDLFLLTMSGLQTSASKAVWSQKFREEQSALAKTINSKSWKIDDADSSQHLQKLDAYAQGLKDPFLAQDFWSIASNTSFYMKNDQVAKGIYKRLISAQTDLGLLGEVYRTAKRWTEDKRSSDDFNFDGLYQMVDVTNGVISDAETLATIQKMDLSKRLKDPRVMLLNSKLNYKKKNYALCESSLSSLLADTSFSQQSRDYYYKSKDYMGRCLFAQKKLEQAATLYKTPISRRLEAFYVSQPQRKMATDLRFQIGLGMRKDAFQTCGTVFSYFTIAQPFYYTKFLATCYALKDAKTVWPEYLIKKYTKDVNNLALYAKSSPEIGEFLQLIRSYSSGEQSAQAKQLREKIGKKYGDDDLLSLAIEMKN